MDIVYTWKPCYHATMKKKCFHVVGAAFSALLLLSLLSSTILELSAGTLLADGNRLLVEKGERIASPIATGEDEAPVVTLWPVDNGRLLVVYQSGDMRLWDISQKKPIDHWAHQWIHGLDSEKPSGGVVGIVYDFVPPNTLLLLRGRGTQRMRDRIAFAVGSLDAKGPRVIYQGQHLRRALYDKNAWLMHGGKSLLLHGTPGEHRWYWTDVSKAKPYVNTMQWKQWHKVPRMQTKNITPPYGHPLYGYGTRPRNLTFSVNRDWIAQSPWAKKSPVIRFFSFPSMKQVSSIDASSWFHPENQYFFGKLINDRNPDRLWFVEEARTGTGRKGTKYKYVDGTIVLLSRPTLNRERCGQKQLTKWVHQLSFDSYKTRIQADQKLRLIHSQDIPLLQAIKPQDAEATMRIKGILESFKKRPTAFREVARGKVPHRTHSVTLHPNGRHWIAANGKTILLGIREGRTLRVVRSFLTPYHTTSLCLMKDGHLLQGTKDGSVEKYSLKPFCSEKK
jgi:hypothetical protein